MNLRLVLSIFFASISSMILIGAFRFFISIPFFLILLSYIFLQTFLIRIYAMILKQNSNLITKGLFVSLALLVIFLFAISTIDKSYEVKRTANSSTVYELSFVLLPVAYFLSIMILFIIDAFFNKEIKKIRKGRIFFGAISFYGVNFIASLMAGVLLAGLHAITFS